MPPSWKMYAVSLIASYCFAFRSPNCWWLTADNIEHSNVLPPILMSQHYVCFVYRLFLSATGYCMCFLIAIWLQPFVGFVSWLKLNANKSAAIALLYLFLCIEINFVYIALNCKLQCTTLPSDNLFRISLQYAASNCIALFVYFSHRINHIASHCITLHRIINTSYYIVL